MHFRPRLIICFLPCAIRYGAKSCSLKNICSTVATLLFSPYLVSKPGKRPAKSQQQHFYKVEVPARDSRARHRAKKRRQKRLNCTSFYPSRFLLDFVQRRPTYKAVSCAFSFPATFFASLRLIWPETFLYLARKRSACMCGYLLPGHGERGLPAHHTSSNWGILWAIKVLFLYSIRDERAQRVCEII